MNTDTRELLKECSAGCRLAVQNLNQIVDFAENEKLKDMILKYKEEHIRIEEETEQILKECKESGKEPGLLAEAFAKITTEMKLMLKSDSGQIAKLLMDGCNMGVQSIEEAIHKYGGASGETKELAEKIVRLEETMVQDLKQFRYALANIQDHRLIGAVLHNLFQEQRPLPQAGFLDIHGADSRRNIIHVLDRADHSLDLMDQICIFLPGKVQKIT